MADTATAEEIEIPPAPLTLEGFSVLHQMFRIRRAAWRQLPPDARAAAAAEAAETLEAMERSPDGQSAVFSLVGHKGDLMLIHFRRSVEELKRAELALQQLRLGDYLEPSGSYTAPIADRGRMMREHGITGRRFADEVRQIITGSMGLDDWEWGVTLWSADPLWFKKLIYEMRFDEASAVYADFGPFYVGVRCPAASLGVLLDGHLP